MTARKPKRVLTFAVWVNPSASAVLFNWQTACTPSRLREAGYARGSLTMSQQALEDVFVVRPSTAEAKRAKSPPHKRKGGRA